ncbi:Glycine serine hydroxymethyltransferase [Klebsormidium nitens]|uniref:Glycine serine hydroxymethyltransferase n=1 Tax=Klebsormidium nitens TaxID=105231 RepID=A0A1Y1IRF2_KLENI|nr:Glycine serine hydroxymethyltransferase [Klebsormidium nitens]|eukprot:GAQ93263.1 Glycine serine hydroxymethyltransferase [Klebsormidium nitens]
MPSSRACRAVPQPHDGQPCCGAEAGSLPCFQGVAAGGGRQPGSGRAVAGVGIHPGVGGGGVNHLALVGLRPNGTDGADMKKVLERLSIMLNKNSVPGKKSALTQGAGTPLQGIAGLAAGIVRDAFGTRC